MELQKVLALDPKNKDATNDVSVDIHIKYFNA